jgi:hypothetical protein
VARWLSTSLVDIATTAIPRLFIVNR